MVGATLVVALLRTWATMSLGDHGLGDHKGRPYMRTGINGRSISG